MHGLWLKAFKTAKNISISDEITFHILTIELGMKILQNEYRVYWQSLKSVEKWEFVNFMYRFVKTDETSVHYYTSDTDMNQ